MKKLISLFLIMSTAFASASTADDNEIMITQTGDTLILYIDQLGFGNKIGLNDFSSGGSNMTITGASLGFNIDMIGDQNKLFGPVVATNSTYDMIITGNSNSIDWNIGYIGSSTYSDMDFTVTGNSNTFDLDHIDNDINTLQKDGAYSKIVFSLDGNDANVDIIQTTGTCVGGSPCANPISNLVLDVTSNDAIIQINQKDSAGDS